MTARSRAALLLRPFTEVRPEEIPTALLMFANLFLLLLGYYILRTVREPLILASGAEFKSYSSAGQALALIAFVPFYSWVASKVDRVKLIFGLVAFFIVNIELFSFAGRMGMSYVGLLFYIWVGIFSLASIAQFWSYANDIYAREAGERLFPFIFLGATLGAPVGGKVAEKLFDAGVSPYDAMHVTAALLCVHLGLYWVVNRRESRRPDQAALASVALSAAAGGFRLVFARRYLTLLAILIVLLNVVNSVGNFIVDQSVLATADATFGPEPSARRDAYLGSFYGRFNFTFATLGLLIQAFLVSRIVKHLGMRGVILALPLVALGAYGLMAAGAGIAVIRWAKATENATDYSVMNTGRQLVWLPTGREEKYKAKQAIDTFFVRTGDVMQAGVIFLGTHWLGLGVTGFTLTNLVLIVPWLAVAFLLLREYERLLRKRASEGTPP